MCTGDRHVVQSGDGTDIHFETYGDRAKPAIFLGPHFYMSRPPDDGSCTSRWIEELQQDFRLIVADYPRGTGLTGNPWGLAYSPDIAAQECSLIADAAGAQRFGWLGYSYGGAVGVQLACRTNRLSALAVGGFPPLNAPFRRMIEILSAIESGPPSMSQTVSLQIVRTALGFYRPLADWAERTEVARINIPRLVFMGDRDTAEGMPPPWTVPLADNLRAAENELRALAWQISWLAGHDHRTAIRPEVSLPVVQRFFRDALC